MTENIRVLVVDDSVTSRALLSTMLASEPGIEVVGYAASGEAAVEAAQRLRPSLITMDVYMPGMDGLEATREIMSTTPTPIVIVSSASPTAVNLSLEATAVGALTVIAKPQGHGSPDFENRQAEFVALIRSMAQVKVIRRWNRSTRTPTPAGGQSYPPQARRPAQIIAIAASTGGPAIVLDILRSLPRDFPLPVLLVQHIARGFSQGLAEWLKSSTQLNVKVAEHGESLRRATVYVAPDDRHLGVKAGGSVLLSSDPAIGGFRPSANFLFSSVGDVYGPEAAGVILTGMGRDGVEGLIRLNAAGGQVVAQDEASCVVYGMPQEAVKAGVVHSVLPGSKVGSFLKQIAVRRIT